VFSPQIIENFRRGSADGLSIVFIVIWLAGDVFNILGAVLQGVLPTMVILAVYYTFADIVLLLQCFYYRGFTLSDEPTKKPPRDETTSEQTALLAEDANHHAGHGALPGNDHRNRSLSHLTEHIASMDGAHLSPATPLLNGPRPDDPPATRNMKPTSTAQAIIFNTFAIILVCGAGAFGWWVSSSTNRHRGHHGRQTEDKHQETPQFDTWGQFFGYLCAAFYLGSRVPQLLLNYRRKSVEGVSLLFFLFACIGNLTYVLSIFAYSPICHHPAHCRPGEATSIYGRYILVNLSWLLGSFGTLLLDMGIFAQFFLYRKDENGHDDDVAVHDRDEIRGQAVQ